MHDLHQQQHQHLFLPQIIKPLATCTVVLYLISYMYCRKEVRAIDANGVVMVCKMTKLISVLGARIAHW